jgi:adenylate kinase family enzyme
VTPRILIFGNSGSGKTTMARRLVEELGVVHLDLDTMAWRSPGERLSVAESGARIRTFLEANPAWVIEGCYGDLLEVVVPFCEELRFLNPGIEACLANCRSRPWEPHKYETPEEQERMLDFLLDWVREYPMRSDEYSLARHREIFDRFPGPKQEFSQP